MRISTHYKLVHIDVLINQEQNPLLMVSYGRLALCNYKNCDILLYVYVFIPHQIEWCVQQKCENQFQRLILFDKH